MESLVAGYTSTLNMEIKRIAIIPARGGSKRIPRKNIIKFNGKPMISWTIEAAIESKLFSKILVSTDDDEIAQISLNAGAQVPFLRNDSNDDYSTSSQATLSALRQAEAYWSETYSSVTQLMANCPLRDSDEIRGAISNFELKKVPSQISCFKFGWMNPWWAFKLDLNGNPEYAFPKYRNKRSQDLPTLYCPTGAIWIADAFQLKKNGTFYMQNHVFYPINNISAIDIDDEHDLKIAEAFSILKKSKREN
jgi:CMP-N-acetylneuraminic acid synthetase